MTLSFLFYIVDMDSFCTVMLVFSYSRDHVVEIHA